MHQPVIACINGGCVGIGLSMALACDLRFASEDAKIGVIFPQRGLIAEDGMGYFMPHLMGRCPPSPPLSFRRGEGSEPLRHHQTGRVSDGGAFQWVADSAGGSQASATP